MVERNRDNSRSNGQKSGSRRVAFAEEKKVIWYGVVPKKCMFFYESIKKKWVQPI